MDSVGSTQPIAAVTESGCTCLWVCVYAGLSSFASHRPPLLSYLAIVYILKPQEDNHSTQSVTMASASVQLISTDTLDSSALVVFATENER